MEFRPNIITQDLGVRGFTALRLASAQINMVFSVKLMIKALIILNVNLKSICQ